MTIGQSANQKVNSTEWAQLGSTVWRRIAEPIARPTYVFYFLLSMIIGSVGVWISLVDVMISNDGITGVNFAESELYQSILTFFAAVGSISCVQILIVEDSDKNLRSLFVLVLILFLVLATLAALLGTSAQEFAVPIIVLGTLLAALTWWIANWDDGKFAQTNPEAPLGGSPGDEAAGDTEGFNI